MQAFDLETGRPRGTEPEHAAPVPPTKQPLASSRLALTRATEAFARRLACQPDEAHREAPLAELQELAALGLMTAPLPEHLGGLGLGTEHGGHLPLLRILAAVGGADLALGRLYEGHVNGLLLVSSFGSAAQQKRAADDARAGQLFGVWNTGEPVPMQLAEDHGKLRMQGRKSFATGAAFVKRPIVTVEYRGWQMTLPRMECDAVSPALHIDRSSWHPLGMERSESYTIDFSGAELAAEDLIGAPGDFYRDPLFRGGAVRFAAVQAGAVLALGEAFTQWLTQRGRQGDPYQLARLGEVRLAMQECALWLEHAAGVAEQALWPWVNEADAERMVQTANMMRLAVERLATATMPRIIAGVGAHGLLRPARFARMLRDLTMYLRQPNPDGALADVGRYTLSHTTPEEPATLWTEGD